jgi:nitrate reductase alpha subunit
MAMGHVVLTEFFRDRRVPYFDDYVRGNTDLPFLVTLAERDGSFVADRFLTAADLGEDCENPHHKTVILEEATGRPVIPNGSLGFRYGETGAGRWNLDLEGVRPALSLLDLDPSTVHAVEVDLARFDVGDTEGGATARRGVPVTCVGDTLVTSVFDLLMATYGVKRQLRDQDLPGTCRPDTAMPTTRTHRPGRSRSPACLLRWRSGSAASSRATPRGRRGGR